MAAHATEPPERGAGPPGERSSKHSRSLPAAIASALVLIGLIVACYNLGVVWFFALASAVVMIALFEMLDSFDRAGLTRVINDYLGERPTISVEKCRRSRLRAIDCSSPGSQIGTSPRCNRATLSASTSTHQTSDPSSAKPAAVTRPAYPVPITAIGSRAEAMKRDRVLGTVSCRPRPPACPRPRA